MTLRELVAKALWDVVPYDRVMEWNSPRMSAALRQHYLDRADKLMLQFDMVPKGLDLSLEDVLGQPPGEGIGDPSHVDAGDYSA